MHDLARVAALADAHVALVSDRPHRAALLPYYAMEKLLQDTQNGLYDVRVMRSLLASVSLFPIGSCIALNDGRVGRVLRARDGHFDRPIIELWDPDRLHAKPAMVSLVEHPKLKVQRAIPALRAA